MNWVKVVVLFALAWTLALRAQAASGTISVPKEELARESVLPIFPNTMSVKNRNVMTEGRMDLNLYYGLALSEPIYNVNRMGLSLYYHTSESNAFGVVYAANSGGLSQYAGQIDTYLKSRNNGTGDGVNFGRAPYPKNTLMADWNWKMFYGKMSLTKNVVFNLNLYTTLGFGMVQYSHKSYPVLAPGIGQKFYLTNNLALRVDLRMFANQAPIPFLGASDSNQGIVVPRPGSPHAGKDLPKPADFQERLTYTTVLDAGLTWLF